MRTFEMRILKIDSTSRSLLVDLDRREADALLEDVLVVAEGGGHHAADVGHVRDVRRVGEHLALVEVRLDDDELRQVAVRAVGVVREHDVAGARFSTPISAIAVGTTWTVEPICAGHERRLRDHLRLTVEDDAREVERLVEHRRVARPHHRDPHLLAGRDEVVADDLEQERIGADRGVDVGGGHAAPSDRMRRLAYSSTRATAPGGSSVVASTWPTIAGPASSTPAGRFSRR